jgi:hypothetical protein
VQGGAVSEVAPVLIEAATDTRDGASANRCGDGRVVLHERQQARLSMLQGSRGGSVGRLTSQRLWCLTSASRSETGALDLRPLRRASCTVL